jgi:DNA-binding transcriptional LysR family regulator
MSGSLNWDEFRIVRAIAESQSLYGAAERLGLNHSTMFRRLAALETRLGFKLFERDRSGYRPTAAGEDMVSLATLMGDTIAEFERRVGSQDLQLTGQVRLSTADSIAWLVLPRAIAEFRSIYPGVNVEISSGPAPLDLFDGQIDIALRVLQPPLSSELMGKRVASVAWAVYASPNLIAPGDVARLASAPWVTATQGACQPQAHRWIARNVEPTRQVAQTNSVVVMAELAARGVGAALLPCLVGDARPELARVGGLVSEAAGELWLVASPAALNKGRVRVLYDFLMQEVERRRAAFEGESTPRD